MRKETYVAPKLDVVTLNNEDIIMTSQSQIPETPAAVLTTTGTSVGEVTGAQIFG